MPAAKDFMERLDKLGVSQELKENIIFEEDSKFSKFSNLFLKSYFREMWRRNQIGYLLLGHGGVMLKMYLKRNGQFPSGLAELKCDNIIVGAYVQNPEHIFCVANVWIKPDKIYGLYKMKYCNDLLIHSMNGVEIKNAFKLGYIESTESIMNIYGYSLMGCSVSCGASKSDKLYILPWTISCLIENIMASVPSENLYHYLAWKNLQNGDWKSYKDHCEPVPVYKVPVTTNEGAFLKFTYFPAVNKRDFCHTYHEKYQFINREKIWNILNNRELPEKVINNELIGDTPVTLVLDECFDSDYVREYFKLKFKYPKSPNIPKSITKIMNWMISNKIGIHMLNDYDISNIRLVFNRKSSSMYPIMNEHQYGFMLEQSDIAKKSKSAFLVLLFKALEKNSIDYLEEGHSFTEYLKSDHVIWKDLDSNMIHYRLTSSKANYITYERVFPRLKPDINFIRYGYGVSLSCHYFHKQKNDEEKRLFLDTYSASALRLSLAHGMLKIVNFEKDEVNGHIRSLHSYLELVKVYSKLKSDDESEEMDELDKLFLNASSGHFLKAHSAYSTFSFRQVVVEGWIFARSNLKEYINRKNLLKKKPNTQLIIQFLKRQLRLLYPIIPAYACYCWNELLELEESIEMFENIPKPDTKYIIVAYLIHKVMRTGIKRSVKTVRISVCEKKLDWHLKAFCFLKTHEELIDQVECMTEMVKYIKEHELPIQSVPFIRALILLYKSIGPEILDNDWDEYELIQPHMDWISERNKSSGKQVNFHLERSSTINPFFPQVKFEYD